MAARRGALRAALVVGCALVCRRAAADALLGDQSLRFMDETGATLSELRATPGTLNVTVRGCEVAVARDRASSRKRPPPSRAAAHGRARAPTHTRA
jgi:hypothetical protein